MSLLGDIREALLIVFSAHQSILKCNRVTSQRRINMRRLNKDI